MVNGFITRTDYILANSFHIQGLKFFLIEIEVSRLKIWWLCVCTGNFQGEEHALIC